MADVNSVVISGNLTRDPELKTTSNGTPVCELRVATNTRRRNAAGEWEDKPNFFNVTVWGGQGENAAKFLSKGRPVMIQGRLEWDEWDGPDGQKRQAVRIVADFVKFVGGPGNGNAGGAGAEPAAASDGGSAAAATAEDDLPF